MTSSPVKESEVSIMLTAKVDFYDSRWGVESVGLDEAFGAS